VTAVGRLFWKFFFSYWLALVVAVFGTSTAVWLYRLAETGPGLALEAGPRATFVVGSAAATLRHGGVAAVKELMADWERRGHVGLFIVDERGRDVLDRPVSAAALAEARGRTQSSSESGPVRLVRRPGGESYLIFVPADAEPPIKRFLFRGGPPSPMVPLVTGILASLFFGALLAWYVSRPIRHLRGAFGALAAGRLETRVASLIGRRRDDVADLGRDFDRMAQQLQVLIDAQRSLLHDVSHELRSPLARLQAAIGLARQSPRKIEGSLERIEREAERVDELVGELLALSRLEARIGEETRQRVQDVDIVDLVAGIVADAEFEAQATGRAVVLSGADELIADVEPELLHRAFENVIRNAVRLTREGTTVEVEIGLHAAGGFRMRVADRGPGVPETETERIFEPFHRVASGAPETGFGLGLAIARRAIEAHGGRIRASNREGGGLVVEITVPPSQRPSSS